MNKVFGLKRAACALMLAGFCAVAGMTQAQYYPSMVYGAKQPVAPGVTWQTATNASPAWSIQIIEVDMTNRNVEVMPVFKARGNVSGSTNERTSVMARRTNAVAAINAGYYNTTNLMTNSYTEIDGIFIGGAGTNMTPENNRSVLGFSGNHQEIPKRTKLSNAFVPADPTDWDKIVDAIAGRGHFVTAGGTVVTQDNEGTTADHNAQRHPRTAIGYTADPYTVYLVAVDGRQTGFSGGMTYTELAQLMADLGVEQSISLDGGGSTTAWVEGPGIVNSPSDGSERFVVSAWVVVTANTMDNTVDEVSVSGTWTTDTAHADLYYIDQLVTDDAAGPATVTWTPNLEQEGLYRVFAWWTDDAGRATAAPYEIVHAGGSDVVTVDQTAGGGQWNVLGVFPFEDGVSGSVTLTNSAAGTVSADAVRFVRVGEIPMPEPPIYSVTSLLYETDFESDQSGSFTIAQHVSGDNPVNFSYDYSAFSQTGGGRPQSIPQSPNSTGAGTRALRMATNVNNGVVNAVTATLTSITGQQNMRITFDAWINYNGPSGGGSGSTENLTFGASANASLVAMGASTYTGTHQPFSGFWFGMTGEGGASLDYRYHDGNGSGGATGVNTVAGINNGARANFFGIGAVDHAEVIEVFQPIEVFETPGAPGKGWLQCEILVLDGKIRFSFVKPDGMKVVACDWFEPNAVATMTGLRPHLGTMDTFASLANPAADNFVLYDNLKVESIEPFFSGSETWILYQ